MAKNRVRALDIESINAAALLPAYQLINGGGFENGCFLIRIINASNVTVLISYDGILPNDVIPAGQVLQVSAQANALPNGYVAMFGKGQKVYAASAIAGIGFVAVTGYYTPQS